MARFPAALLIAALTCAGVFAQPLEPAGPALGADPASIKMPEKPKEDRPPAPTPFSLAISLAFSSATCSAVGISTSTPHEDIARLLETKRYRLELIQLVLMAERSGKTAAYLDSRHKKDVTLRMLAEELKLDFDAIYDEALEIRRKAAAKAQEYARVRAGPAPSGEEK